MFGKRISKIIEKVWAEDLKHPDVIKKDGYIEVKFDWIKLYFTNEKTEISFYYKEKLVLVKQHPDVGYGSILDLGGLEGKLKVTVNENF
jgi:hypothetical protein